MPIIPQPAHSRTSGIRSGEHADILRVQDIDDSAMWSLWSEERNALLYRLMSIMRKGSPVHDPTHTYIENDKPPIYIELKSTMDAGSGEKEDIEYDENVLVKNTMLVDEETGEWFIVSNDPSAESTHWKAHITRGYQGTTAGLQLDAGKVLRVGLSMLPEGADHNNGFTHQPTTAEQYATFFSESVGITDVQLNSRTLFGIHSLSDQEKITLLRCMEQMDTQLRFGKKNRTGTGPANEYTSDGFTQKADNDITLSGSQLTWPLMNDAFNPLWDNYTGSSPSKVALFGPALFDAITKTAYDRWVAAPAFEARLGAVVVQINLTSGGTLELIRDNWGFKTTPNRGFIIDLNKVELKEMGGMELQFRDVTQPDSHTIKREVYGSIMPIWRNPQLHAVVTHLP